MCRIWQIAGVPDLADLICQIWQIAEDANDQAAAGILDIAEAGALPLSDLSPVCPDGDPDARRDPLGLHRSPAMNQATGSVPPGAGPEMELETAESSQLPQAAGME